MAKIKFLLFVFIMFFTPSVFASEYNMNSHTSGTLNGTTNRYQATEIVNSGSSNTYTFGTRYNGKISTIETYFSYPFEENTTYTLTYNMNTEDFRNKFGGTYWWDCEHTMNATNQHTGSFTYVSYKKVKFTFTPTENTTCIRVFLGSTNLSSTGITGISNWRLDSITLFDPYYQSGSGGGGSSPSPTPSSDTSTIINNNNQNTSTIINNNNQNTQDVINNNNENTEKIIDNQNVLLGNCYKNLIDVENSRNSSGYYGYMVELEDGETYTLKGYNGNFGYKIGSYIQGYTDIEDWTGNKSSYTFTYHRNPNNSSERYVFLFTVNQNSETSITLPNNNYKFVLTKGNYNGDFIPYLEQKCSSKIDETNAAINDVNDTLNDDSEPTINFVDVDVSSDTPVSDLLLMPFTILNKLIDTLDTNACVNYILPFDFFGGNYSITFPCFTIGDYLGSFTGVFDALICFFMIYEIAMMCVSIFNNITSLRDSFDGLYTPKHHDTSTRVGRGELEGKY